MIMDQMKERRRHGKEVMKMLHVCSLSMATIDSDSNGTVWYDSRTEVVGVSVLFRGVRARKSARGIFHFQ